MIAGLILAMVSDIEVLIYSRTEAFRHESIEPAVQTLKALGQRAGWNISHTEDAHIFINDIEKSDVVIFLHTTGDVLHSDGQKAFSKWLHDGGGFIGIHAAADTEYDWPLYGNILGGAWFQDHPPIQKAAVVREDHAHPSLAHAPARWVCTDEWFNYKKSPRGHVHVIAHLDESSYQGGTMAGDHPIVWSVPIGEGVALYTGLGHTESQWADPVFQQHITASVDWAANQGRIPLHDLDQSWTTTTGWRPAGNISVSDDKMSASDGEGILTNAGSTSAGNLTSNTAFGDCELRLQFMVPQGGNSGVFLQNRYEVQIFDSHGKEQVEFSDCGGIFERWDPQRNPHGYEGHAPGANASLPHGQWQTLEIIFRAPRFDQDGQKTQDARFDRVTLNGIVIHENLTLSGPTRGGGTTETPLGPIRLQGDHGPVAYRGIEVRRISSPQ